MRESSSPYDTKSVLLQQTKRYKELTILGRAYSNIRIFRNWQFGRDSILRQPQRADARNDLLEEDFSNLGLFLNRLRKHPEVKLKVLSALNDLMMLSMISKLHSKTKKTLGLNT